MVSVEGGDVESDGTTGTTEHAANNMGGAVGATTVVVGVLKDKSWQATAFFSSFAIRNESISGTTFSTFFSVSLIPRLVRGTSAICRLWSVQTFLLTLSFFCT